MKPIASFISTDRSEELIPSLVLEYADQGDLGQYFADTAPPRSEGQIKEMWIQMLGLADALRLVHNSVQDGREYQWYCKLRCVNYSN